MARMPALEQRIASDPENLATAAEYRELVIESRAFDRSIDFFEKLAKRKETGPNVHISLALAYIDKAPTSGDLRRIYLARDAMDELTKAIERRPTVLAYYVRGRINLFFNNFIFRRIPRGLADLERARTLIDENTPTILAGAVDSALGDGHWRLGDRTRARELWRRGLERYPAHEWLKSRALSDDAATDRIVSESLYSGTRVDTSLRGVVR